MTLDGVMQAPGGPGRGRQRRLRPRRLVGERVGRTDGSGHGRGDEPAVRPRARTQDLRHLRRSLAARHRRSRCPAIERRHQTRRVAGSSHTGVEQLGADRGRRPQASLHSSRKSGQSCRCTAVGTCSRRSCATTLSTSTACGSSPSSSGQAKRLFSDGAIPSALKLVNSTVSTTGVVIGTYEPAGEIVFGSFALD